MKRKLKYYVNRKEVEREVVYIPLRYIFAVLISLLEIVAIISIVVACCYYIPFFYVAAWVTEIVCVVRIIASDDNPDYKVPWLLFVLILPIVGFMLYFMFYSRKLKKRMSKRLQALHEHSYKRDDSALQTALREESPAAFAQAKMLTDLSGSHLFINTKQTYFSLGEELHRALLDDLAKAEQFILMEYFIIEEGEFWSSILAILKEKAAAGVVVKVLYDDIGCMSTLPGNYQKVLRKMGIDGMPFSRLRGNADSEFNNRNHRKITVIDGKVGYTGGVNIADEYINKTVRFGHWKDIGLRLEGEAVFELTKLFLLDFGINVREMPRITPQAFPVAEWEEEPGYLIPFGDGPRPIYERRVGKSVIRNMLAASTRYMYMTTPYLIIDNEMCECIENAAMRGVDVKIIVPHIPDKKLVFSMTKSFYKRLIDAGVEIYEYEPGFIHAKSYLSDDEYAMIGTINLDYRSLVHHFENGVWMYRCACIEDIRADIEQTLAKSIRITPEMLKAGLLERMIRALVRIFAPLL